MKTYSLTRRLVWAIVLVELCSTLALVASAGIYEDFTHFRAFDVMLRGRADSMLGAVQDAGDAQDNVMLNEAQSSAPKRDIYAVRDELGRMLGHSANWLDPLPEFQNTGQFHSIRLDGRRYRVIRVEGLRMVDPGEEGGGIARHVVILYGAPTHPVWRSIWTAVSFYAVFSVLLLGVSVLVMLRLLRKGLAPLADLAGEAAGVSAASWTFAPSDSVRSVRELAPLASALETALARLERSFDQQKQFVSDAAHELKTSVAVLKSSLQVLMMKDRSAPEYRAGLERAQEDCARMEALVMNMLMLASLEAERTHPGRVEQIDLGEVVREVNEHFRAAAEVAGVTTVVLVEGSIRVDGDRDKLRLLISNLMHNALQHSSRGAEVRMCVANAKDQAELRIEDYGEGIAPEVLPFVFDRFFRGDVSRSRRTGGTGLGLAIARAIVQEMNGQIRIESKVGHGTQVLLSFPIPETSQPWSGPGA